MVADAGVLSKEVIVCDEKDSKRQGAVEILKAGPGAGVKLVRTI